MSTKMNFSNPNTSNVFADKSYAEFSQLMFDTGMKQPKMEVAEANDTIRDIFFEVLEVSPDCNRKELKKAIRKHKTDLFEVMEEAIENLLVSGWGENPFFRDYVEMKSYDLGDTNEFYTKDDIILTVSELSGNHHSMIRQKLNEGSTFSVKTSWYGVRF